MIYPVKIVFMGSPAFAVPILKTLAGRYPILGVVTQPDRPAGRGQILVPPPVKVTAQSLGIPVIQPEKLRLPEAMGQLLSWQPEVIVVAAFGQILRKAVLDLPPFGCINVHASLLPRWRGAAPIQAAILAGDVQTGVTIMKMDAGVDTGPTLSQRSLPIAPDDTGGSLLEKLSSLGADLLLETLPPYLNGELIPQPQSGEGATYAPMLKKEDGRLDFTHPAAELERRVRAMNPWPGAYFDWHGQPLKIHKAHSTFDVTHAIQPPGTHSEHNGLPAVYGCDNTLLVVDEVQPAGKKSMPGRAFLLGARDWAS